MPSTSTLMLPSGSFRLCTMLTMVPTWKMSPALGSSMLASCWVARNIFLSPARASSSARTLDSRPTTKGVIMYGKMTTSRMGIMGSRFVSDLSLEVSILEEYRPGTRDIRNGHPRSRLRFPEFAYSRFLKVAYVLASLFEQGHVDLLRHDHLLGYQELANLFIRREIVHEVEHQILQDHPQAPRTHFSFHRQPGDGFQ